MKTKTVRTEMGSVPGVAVLLGSEAAKRDAALRVVDGVLLRPDAGRAPLSALEWAALRHLQERARRANQIPGLARLGFQIELSPALARLLTE